MAVVNLRTLKFDTEELAKKHYEAISGESIGFCPLARNACLHSCVCYKNARIQEGQKRTSSAAHPETVITSQYTVYPPYCDNDMFWGE